MKATATARITNGLSSIRVFGLFQAGMQFGRITRSMKNRQHGEDLPVGGKVYGIGFESSQAYNSRPAPHQAKPFRLVLPTFNSLAHLLCKCPAQARSFMFIPRNRLGEFRPGRRLKNDGAAHHQPKRCRISALTCSRGIPAWGSFSKATSRRSNSAVCSAVNSASLPPSPAQTFSAISYCSSGGSRRICSKISDALMSLIYRVKLPAQAEFHFCPGARGRPNLAANI